MNRQHEVIEWARRWVNDPTMLYYLATDVDSANIMRRQIRMVVQWALTPNAVDNDDHWAAAEMWMTLSVGVWKQGLDNQTTRGRWTLPLSAHKLTPVDPDTLLPADWPDGVDAPARSTATNREAERHYLGW